MVRWYIPCSCPRHRPPLPLTKARKVNLQLFVIPVYSGGHTISSGGVVVSHSPYLLRSTKRLRYSTSRFCRTTGPQPSRSWCSAPTCDDGSAITTPVMVYHLFLGPPAHLLYLLASFRLSLGPGSLRPGARPTKRSSRANFGANERFCRRNKFTMKRHGLKWMTHQVESVIKVIALTIHAHSVASVHALSPALPHFINAHTLWCIWRSESYAVPIYSHTNWLN